MSTSISLRSLFLKLHVGGYWASGCVYTGGKLYTTRLDYETPTLAMLSELVLREGFSENMCKFSYFEELERIDLCVDKDVESLVARSELRGIIELYVVRMDDPYLDDVLIGEKEEEHESDGEECNFYKDDYVESDNSDDDVEVSEFYVGKSYVSKESCKEAIEKYAVREKMNIFFKKSERKKVEAQCCQEVCNWRIYCSINSRSTNMVVRTYMEKHSCYSTGVVKLYSAPKIAADFLNEFRTNNTLSAKEIKQRLIINGLRVSKSKCQSARQIMLHIICDEYAEQFTRLYDYVRELQKSNPGSTVILGTLDRVFEKFYTCFASQKIGWKSACRRVIYLDGTFLKGRIKGMLLTAVGRDPNNQMYIIAWAIVPAENKVYWEWFMELLQEDLDLGDGIGLALSSDQQKRLIYVIQKLLPYAEHRMCARHIYANLKKRHPGLGPLHKLFWKCARSYNRVVFERRLEQMQAINQVAYEEIKATIRSNWSRAFFNDFSKSDSVENNLSESYNAVLDSARRKPIIAMLEDIRRQVMTSNDVKLQEIKKATDQFTPKALALMKKRKKSLQWCYPLSAGRGWYEVDHGMNKYRVCVRESFSCSCRAYEVSGIPCCHLMSAMWNEYGEELLPETLISDWYSVEKWKLCYNSLLLPVNGMQLWEKHSDVTVMPPPDRIMPGRPKKNYCIRDPSEETLSAEKFNARCGNCREVGHNKRRCINPFVPKPPALPTGRPRSRKQS